MRPIRGPRFWGGLTVVLSVIVVGGLLALTLPYVLDGQDDAAPATSSSAPSATASASASSAPTATAGQYEMDYQALEAVGEGWALATAVDESGAVTLMAIDPVGGLYEGTALPDGAELVGWLATAQAVIYDPATTELYSVVIVDGTETSFGEGWEDPEVALASDGAVEQILVLSGPEGERTVSAVDIYSGEATVLAEAADRHGLVSSSDGTTALTAVGGEPTDIAVSSATGEASAGNPGGAACAPGAWDSGRQAIVVCADEETTVWALEPTTGTYAAAATLPAAGDSALAVSGSRLLVAGSVYGADGAVRFALPDEAADATDAAFTGDILVLWSVGGDGVAERVWMVSDAGKLAGVAGVPEGYVGFAQVFPAPTYSF